jgi:hypothetical protein
MKHHAEARNMLMCLRTLQEMKDAEVSPDILTVETLVTAACKEFLPRLGHAFAVDYEQKSARRLTLTTWTQILASSAHAYYVGRAFFASLQCSYHVSDGRSRRCLESRRGRWRYHSR